MSDLKELLSELDFDPDPKSCSIQKQNSGMIFTFPSGGYADEKSRFTEEQIVFALRQAELGTPVPEVCRKLGISDTTFYIYGLPPFCKY
jgi:putative transposase